MKFKLKGSTAEKLTVSLPPSKSYAQRALIAASLAEGRSRVVMGKPLPEDVVLMIRALRKMGIKIKGDSVYGTRPKTPSNVLNMGASGTGLRFMTAFSTLAEDGYTILTGNTSLLKRPIGPLVEAINLLGGYAIAAGENGRPPVIVKGKKMKGGKVEIKSSESSQYISALLLVSPKNEAETRIYWENKVSEHYVRMTEYVMNAFGVEVHEEENSYLIRPSDYRPVSFKVPPDASSASFFIIFAMLAERQIEISGLAREPIQADLEELVKVLEAMGIKYSFEDSGMRVYGKVPDKPLKIDLKNAPDLFPPLSVLGCRVPVEIYGISHVKFKESNRLLSMGSELSKLGCKVESNQNEIKIIPSGTINKGISLKGWKDHRVVMALSVLCAALGISCTIDGYETVKKSYPTFFEEMKKNGFEVEVFER